MTDWFPARTLIFRPRNQNLLVRQVRLITCKTVRISKRTRRGHLAYAAITDVRSSYEEDIGDSVVSLSCAVSICEVNNEQEHVTRQ